MKKPSLAEFNRLYAHVSMDIGYSGGGTFNLGDDDHSFDKKSAEKVIKTLNQIYKILYENPSL